MALAGLLVDLRALVANGWSLAAVPQLRGREFDRTVAMLMHVQSTSAAAHWQASSLPAKGRLGYSGRYLPVFGSAEQRHGVGVVVRHPRAR